MALPELAPSQAAPSRILLTGATGFVGRHLWPALHEAGHEVRCLSRNAGTMERRQPDRRWIQGDLADAASLREALRGVDVAYYLVHAMGEGHHDFRRREVDTARRFLEAAEEAGVQRIIYLGGPAPEGTPSEHLRSRLEVGALLRGGAVPTLELRASMIIGHGSLSWRIVRDLSARLPVMLLPRWLRARTQPIAIDDVVVALSRALDLALPESAWFDIPGPTTLTGREILERTATELGLLPPRIVEVPVLTPWLSSHWVHFVTRAKWAVAREVVLGLTDDLLAESERFWSLIGHPRLLDFNEAARRAIAAERQSGEPITGLWGMIERWIARIRRAPRAA